MKFSLLLATCLGAGLIAGPALAGQTTTDKDARPKATTTQASPATIAKPDRSAVGRSRSDVGTGVTGANPTAGGPAIPDTSGHANSDWQSQLPAGSGLGADANSGWQSQLPAGSGLGVDQQSQVDNALQGPGNIGGASQGGIGRGATGQGFAGPHFNNGGTAGVAEGGIIDKMAKKVSDGCSAIVDTASDLASVITTGSHKPTIIDVPWQGGSTDAGAGGSTDAGASNTGADASTKYAGNPFAAVLEEDDRENSGSSNGNGNDGGSSIADTGPKGDTGPNATGQLINNGNGAGGGDAGGGQGSDSASGDSGGANAQGQVFNGGNAAGGDAPLHKPQEQGQLKASVFNNGVTDPVQSCGVRH